MRLAFYGVLSDETATIVEVYPTRAEAEELVAIWNRDEPGLAGQLRVIRVDLTLSEN